LQRVVTRTPATYDARGRASIRLFGFTDVRKFKEKNETIFNLRLKIPGLVPAFKQLTEWVPLS